MHGKVDLLDTHVARRLHRRRARPLWLGRSRRRSGTQLYQPAGVITGHLSLRTEDVRDHGVLGDREHGSRSTTVRARLCKAVQAAEKIVYSRTLAEPRSARTRIEREFDPGAVRRLKADAEHDITVDGPELAAQAIRAGLVDEFQMIVCPVVVGSGKRFFPDGVRLNLELVESDASVRV
jgi:riboflavin biosynthesis pyrimidine reductase